MTLFRPHSINFRQERHLAQQHRVLECFLLVGVLPLQTLSLLTYTVLWMPNISGQQKRPVNQTYLVQFEETQPDIFWKLRFSPHRKWIVCVFWLGLPLPSLAICVQYANMLDEKPNEQACKQKQQTEENMCLFCRFIFQACATPTIEKFVCERWRQTSANS